MADKFQSNLPAAIQDLALSPQEQFLYQMHLQNLLGSGGVNNPPDAQNPQGSRSSLYQAVEEHNNKFYNVPTVWNGVKETRGNTLQNVERTGWDQFPSYASPDEADARYMKMHDYMGKDTGQFLEQNPMIQAIIMSMRQGDPRAGIAQRESIHKPFPETKPFGSLQIPGEEDDSPQGPRQKLSTEQELTKARQDMGAERLPTSDHIWLIKSKPDNMGLRDAFDEMYGSGAAKRYIEDDVTPGEPIKPVEYEYPDTT